ncbi:bifunctional ADP-heptose synthase [Mucilaginibacter panaciglaebae]|uniref:Carbohydrate kinase PfkB domain-containing protein n=1 Tax=Mucilaginibacter panaciglaebae TaxID=502331 RepID=A0ABP7WU43_9SPHI
MPTFNFPYPKEVRIAVMGDIMIDHYINGSCDRISPEAPVQIVDVKSDTYTLGGAGNVLENLHAFGCTGSIISITGDDDYRTVVEAELDAITPGFIYLAKDANRRTTVKSRVVVNKHQLIRLDKEDKFYCDDVVGNQLFEILKSNINNIDVLILSDYCKGVLSDKLVGDAISLCNERNIITLVDSKNKDLSKYRGATVVKPNRKEAALASGIPIVDNESLEAACKKIAEVTNCETVVVTLSEDGIAAYSNNVLIKKPTKAIDVYDVTGAGDTVVAALAFALANKLPIAEACDFANSAAAIVVAKFGSAVATLQEINNLNWDDTVKK